MQQMVLYCKNLFFAKHVSGHHYVHHQELKSIIQVVAACGTWCFGLQIVGLAWNCSCCYSSTPDQQPEDSTYCKLIYLWSCGSFFTRIRARLGLKDRGRFQAGASNFSSVSTPNLRFCHNLPVHVYLRSFLWVMQQGREVHPSPHLFFAIQHTPIYRRALLLESSQDSPVRPSGNSNVYMEISVEHQWNDTERGKQMLGLLREKSVPLPISLPQLSHGQTWYQIWTSEVRGRRLTV